MQAAVSAAWHRQRVAVGNKTIVDDASRLVAAALSAVSFLRQESRQGNPSAGNCMVRRRDAHL